MHGDGPERIGFYADLVLEPDIPVPIYYQLQQQLRGKIEMGRLRPGERLPSERAIAEELQIARTTVRQALDRLCHDGLLVKRPGAGTYVRPLKLVGDLSIPRSLSAEAFAQGHRSETELLGVARMPADASLHETLGIGGEAGEVLRIRRLRRVDGEAATLETSWLPADRCARLLDVDLTGSLTHALERECGVRLVRSRSELSATVLDPYEADLLETESGAAAFRYEATSWDELDRPTEFVTTVLRGDRFRFHGGGPIDDAHPKPYPLVATRVRDDGSPVEGVPA